MQVETTMSPRESSVAEGRTLSVSKKRAQVADPLAADGRRQARKVDVWPYEDVARAVIVDPGDAFQVFVDCVDCQMLPKSCEPVHPSSNEEKY